MAITHAMMQPNHNLIGVEMGVREIPIFGKMVYAQLELNQIDFVQAANDDDARQMMKERLAEKLAQYMFDNNLVEYSVQDNHSSTTKTVRARVCITPDEQTRLLRIHVK
jgi:hypothetical protein